jgi:DNA-binding PadR family transcriptional regulator
MSVPAALTAILTLGPAYGLQLHAELSSRLPHRATTNVGQIYSTLERLVRDGFVERAGINEDGLPLYHATEKGAGESRVWLSGMQLSTASAWSEILDVILIGATLPASPIKDACDHIDDLFAILEISETDTYSRAQESFAQAVRSTTKDVRAQSLAGTLPVRGYSEHRPLRGRRPKL